MNKKLFFLLILFSLLVFSNSVIAVTVTLPNPLCPGGGPNSPTCTNDFQELIRKITDSILILIGGLAALMFIWAGILFVTSAGNEGRLGSAKKALWWAIIGTAIALTGKGLVIAITAIIGT